MVCMPSRRVVKGCEDFEGPGGVERLFWRARRGREALLEGRDSLGGPSGGPVGIGKGWETLLEGQEGWEFLFGGMGVSRGGRRSFWMASWGREAVPKGQKDSGGSADVRRPSWIDGRDWEALSLGCLDGKHLEAHQEGREYSGVVGSPTRRAVSGQEDLLEG